MIGVIGGIGPEAGNYLHSLIIKNTNAQNDREHLNVIVYSANNIPDRSSFLENASQINPAYTIITIIKKLTDLGVNFIIIACNQVYAPSIFGIITKHYENTDVKIANVISETLKQIKKTNAKKIGILSRTGLYKNRIFESHSDSLNYEFLYLEKNNQDILDKTIGDKTFGIKAGYHLVSNQPKKIVLSSIEQLIRKGAEVIVLACTELALVLDKSIYEKYSLLDTNEILAKASVKYFGKLK